MRCIALARDRIRLLRRWFSARGVNPMRRREFIRLFSSTFVPWPLTARAQQSAMPVVGFMISGIQARSQQIAAFQAGLKDTGYVQGQNVTVELRSAEDHFDRYPALVADLLRHGVAVLVAVSNDGAIAAKRATTTTPIVFGMGGDQWRSVSSTALATPAVTSPVSIFSPRGSKESGWACCTNWFPRPR